MNIDRIRVLRALRLKGRVAPADVASASGLTAQRADELLTELIAGSHVEEARGRLKLSASGRELLDHELAAEQRIVDGRQVRNLYQEFGTHNTALKTLMTRWQLKAADTPNDHDDADYDRCVIADLVGIDADFQPLLARVVEVVPRLGHYPIRLSAALSRIGAGDHSWFAKPLLDSYHTVWFELHEELIGLAGQTRVGEAAAGRAE